MGIMDIISRWTERVLSSATSEPPAVSVWGSWSPCHPQHLQALRLAGCDEVILNVNTVDGGGRAWHWQNSKQAILERAQRVVESGMSVAWMPWMWAYPSFATEAGKRIAELDADLYARTGHRARLCQLDWEGHAEHSAAAIERSSGKPLAAVIDDCMTALCEHLPPHIILGITPLYFRRDAGDEVIRWSRKINGRVWQVEELLPQAYSVWLRGNGRKERATHSPQYQPGILQQRCYNNYLPLRDHVQEIGIGLNSWALDRTYPDVPPALRMDARTAMDKAVEECLRLGVQRVAFWALHLMDADNPVDRTRLALTCEAIKRIKMRCGPLVSPTAPPVQGDGERFGDVSVAWGGRYVDGALAEGGGPEGYALPRQIGQSPSPFTAAAVAVRKRFGKDGWPLGTVVPGEVGGKAVALVMQRHPYTFRGGQKVPYGGPGCTVYLKRDDWT